MHGTYVGNNKMLIHTVMGFRLYSFADDKSLTPDLIFSGAFEAPLTNFILKNIQPGDTVIDAGANIGYFTLLLGMKVGKQGKVISYEASKKNFSLLKENVSYHVLGDRADIRNKAVYKEEKELTFYASHSWNGNGSLLKHDDQYFSKFQSDIVIEEKVQGEPLDVHMDRDFIHFIKMDIEGGEFNAFIGLEGLLKSKKIGKIVFELNKLKTDENDKFYELLKSYQDKYSLSFFELDPKGQPIPTTLEKLFEQDFVESVLIDCFASKVNFL